MPLAAPVPETNQFTINIRGFHPRHQDFPFGHKRSQFDQPTFEQDADLADTSN